MFQKSNDVNGSGSPTVTIIGAGVRVEGNIAFSGYLRVQGHIVGNVSCDSESQGTTVVHGLGSVTGSIKTPHIVVGGRVRGPLNASESIEIHGGASVVGDANYKQIAIHEGGIIEGSLMPTAAKDRDQPRPERRLHVSASPAAKECDLQPAHDRRSTALFGGGRKLGAVVALLVTIVAAVAWFKRGPITVAPSTAAVAPELVSAPKIAPPVPVVPAEVEKPKVAPKAAPADAAPLVPNLPAETKAVAPPVSAAPKAPPDRPKADPDKMVTVQGTDPEKSAVNVYVISKEPAVLFRKQRKDPGDGQRIEVGRGANVRIAIAESEVVRIGQGRDLELFYQGRKVAPSTIESGAWISFVPRPPSVESDTR